MSLFVMASINIVGDHISLNDSSNINNSISNTMYIEEYQNNNDDNNNITENNNDDYSDIENESENETILIFSQNDLGNRISKPWHKKLSGHSKTAKIYNIVDKKCDTQNKKSKNKEKSVKSALQILFNKINQEKYGYVLTSSISYDNNRQQLNDDNENNE